jgi:hypothetical protein
MKKDRMRFGGLDVFSREESFLSGVIFFQLSVVKREAFSSPSVVGRDFHEDDSIIT